MSSILRQEDLRARSELEERRILGASLNGQTCFSGRDDVGLTQSVLEEDVRNCPYASSGECVEALTRCLSGDFGYARCDLYNRVARSGC